MKWQARELASGNYPDVVALGLRARYDVADDGTFETPDDLDAGAIRRLEEADHVPADDVDDEADAQGATDEDVADAVEEADDTGSEPAADGDEYDGMDRGDLYDEYKDRGGPKSWNGVSADELRHDLRVHDEQGTFPTEETDE